MKKTAIASVVNESKQETLAANIKSFDVLPDSAFIRQAQLIPNVVPFSSATLWRRCQSGEFPKPRKLSQRVTAWNVGEVRAWLKSQSAA